VGVIAGVFTVLFAAGFAAVALSSVWGEAEFEEVIALAVWAGQGDGDGHENILTPPTTKTMIGTLKNVLPKDEWVMTTDAGITERDLAGKIRKAGGHYFMRLKKRPCPSGASYGQEEST
jgi:hypothetical protein